MDRAIGVFDSGFGGLTVLGEILKELPFENTIYFGDTAHLPYGTKSKESVIRFSLAIGDFLVRQGVKIIVVACNTASSFALSRLAARTRLPVIGVIEPGARSAVKASVNRRIGIIGTEGTIKSGSYEKEIEKTGQKIRIFAQPCPLFVPLVEEGWVERKATLLVAKEYLEPLKKERIDTLILGCTHYPLLKNIITSVMGKEVKLIDSARETAKETKRLLVKKGLVKPEGKKSAQKYFVSDDANKFVRFGRQFLGRVISDIRKVDI